MSIVALIEKSLGNVQIHLAPIDASAEAAFELLARALASRMSRPGPLAFVKRSPNAHLWVCVALLDKRWLGLGGAPAALRPILSLLQH